MEEMFLTLSQANEANVHVILRNGKILKSWSNLMYVCGCMCKYFFKYIHKENTKIQPIPQGTSSQLSLTVEVQ